MQVRLGWSGETSSNVWQKVSIELDELDLVRLMLENGLPEHLHERLPVVIAYELMQSLTEILLMRKLLSLGYPEDKALARVNVLSANIASIVDAAKEKVAAQQSNPGDDADDTAAPFPW